MTENYAKLFKLLGDVSRLKVVASLNKEPMYVELISERLELNPSTVSFHLKKLEQAGLVASKKEQYYTMYYLNKERLNLNIIDVVSSITTKSNTLEERELAYYDKIKSTFFQNGKLNQIPVQRKKRQVILQEIAKDFDLGKEYKEKQVNLIISEYHNDFCTIRREFIMEKLFTRDNGVYKRVK